MGYPPFVSGRMARGGSLAAATGGSAWTNAYSGSFDGGDWLEAPRDDDMNNDELTISAWVKFNAVDANQCFVAKRSGAGGLYFQIKLKSTGYLEFYNGGTIVGDSRSISADTWYHVCVVDDSSNTLIYLNGSSATTSNSGTGDQTSEAPLSIGRLNSTYGQYMDGFIDEVAIWTSALSSTNVATVYNSGTPSDISGLSPFCWYRMGDDNSGSSAISTITDQGASANDAVQSTGAAQPALSTTIPS